MLLKFNHCFIIFQCWYFVEVLNSHVLLRICISGETHFSFGLVLC